MIYPSFFPIRIFFPLLVLHDALQHVGLLPPSEIAGERLPGQPFSTSSEHRSCVQNDHWQLVIQMHFSKWLLQILKMKIVTCSKKIVPQSLFLILVLVSSPSGPMGKHMIFWCWPETKKEKTIHKSSSTSHACPFFSVRYIYFPKRIAYLQFFPHIDTGHLHLQSCQGCFGKFLPCGKDCFFVQKKSLDYEVILKGIYFLGQPSIPR